MIWLPGAYHSVEDFENAGFAREVARRNVAMELEFVDPQLEHLQDRNVVARLRSQYVLPAQAAGREVWMAGISLGGMIALSYAAAHAADLKGICVFAPYLGNRLITAEVGRAATLAEWQPGTLAEDDDERRVWRFIQRRGTEPPLYLGFGKDDRFAAAHRLLATALPAQAVDVIDGGHEWSTWTLLWERFLASNFYG